MHLRLNVINLNGNIAFFAFKLGQLHGQSFTPFNWNREPEPPRTALPCWQAFKETMRIIDENVWSFRFLGFGWLVILLEELVSRLHETDDIQHPLGVRHVILKVLLSDSHWPLQTRFYGCDAISEHLLKDAHQDVSPWHLGDLPRYDVLLLWTPSLTSKNVVHPVQTDGFTLRTRHVKVVANHKLPKLVFIGGKRAHLFQRDHL